MNKDTEKRFVCILSGSREYPTDLITVYKEFNTETEAKAWLRARGCSIRRYRARA